MDRKEYRETLGLSKKMAGPVGLTPLQTHPITQRQWLAGMAMQGIIACGWYGEMSNKDCNVRISEISYKIADAMLENENGNTKR